MNWYRWFIYTVYACALAWMASMVVGVVNVHAATAYKQPKLRSKECTECLIKFIECMKRTNTSADEDIKKELRNECLNKVTNCEIENSCERNK